MAYPYYRPAGRSGNTGQSKSEAMLHLMPLNNGATPKDGPSRSVFSSPSFHYSPQTEQLVKDLMKESRLTSTQRTGFASILRKGQALPIRSSDIYRQEMFRHRHAEKARRQGIPVMAPTFNNPQLPHAAQMYHKFGRGGRRTETQIKKESKELAQASTSYRRYIPTDKEKEKERFAHKMATGKDLPLPEDPLKVTRLPTEKEESACEHNMENFRFLEMVEEVNERVEFLEQMRTLGHEKAYHQSVVFQIQELVQQMKKISPQETKKWMDLLKLEKVDPVFMPAEKRPKPSQMHTLLTGEEI